AGRMMRELLDSGASISLIGRGCRELVERLEIPWKPWHAKVRTANGSQQQILGKVKMKVEYKKRTREILFYLCPSLEQELYLGVNFWQEFEIASELFGVCEVEMAEEKANRTETEKDGHEQHELGEEKTKQLNKIKNSFLNFEENGLGRTEVMKHSIELTEGATPIKDRHYPVSPAVQTLIYQEIDEMLRLGVIEESDSAWSNTITLVRKPGKNRLCLDARKLNKITVKDAYQQQNIEGILSRIEMTRYISSMDLKHAFWQIELD
ncbi:hypothetical protein KR067_006553, partial [Drosophila pandora]